MAIDPRFASTPPTRETFVAFLSELVGLSATSDPARYSALVAFPGDSASLLEAELSESGCALVALGAEREASLDHPILDTSYRIATAVVDVQLVSKDAGAWTAGPLFVDFGFARLEPADLLVLQGPRGAHVATCVRREGLRWWGVEGGQGPGGRGIELVEHELSPDGASDHRIDDPGTWKTIVGMSDFDVLAKALWRATA